MQSEESLRLYQKRLAQAEKRIGELDRLFIRIYEDNVAGRLDDERFAMMSKNYTEEQKDLKAEVKGLQQQIHEQEQQAENIEQFVQRVKRNRHDRDHACSKKFEFYCLTSREPYGSFFL